MTENKCQLMENSNLLKENIIKHLNEWLNNSESREKEIIVNKTTVSLTKVSQPERVNVSVFRNREEVSSFYFYLNEETPKAITIFRIYVQLVSYNLYTLNSALEDIKSLIVGDE